MVNQLISQPKRIEWVDLAKGLTILLVVIMHSTNSVERHLGAEGWMHYVLDYATPFRMPVFFAVAGLFAAKVILKDWRTFLDGKLVHFAYFYIIWMTIQFIFKTPFFVQEFGAQGTALYYLASYVQPFGLLWFIYLLPVYFIVLRLTQKLPMLMQFVLAVAAKLLVVETGVNVVDFFAKYYVFFLVGHFGHALWFKLADYAEDRRVLALAGLGLWAAVNGWMVGLGLHEDKSIAIGMGVAGFLAVVSFMALLPEMPGLSWFASVLRYCGQRSLPIYLGFFLPMGVSRLVASKLCDSCDPGTIAFIVSMISIFGALTMYEIASRLKIGTFLYMRPDWARLKQGRSPFVPAE